MDNYCSKFSSKNFDFKDMLGKFVPETSANQLNRNKKLKPQSSNNLNNDTENIKLNEVESNVSFMNCCTRLDELEMRCNEALGKERKKKSKITEITSVHKDLKKFKYKTDEVNVELNDPKICKSKSNELTLVPENRRLRKHKTSENNLVPQNIKNFKKSFSQTTLVNEPGSINSETLSLPLTKKDMLSVGNQKHEKDVLEIMHSIDNMDDACLSLRKENDSLWKEIEKLAYYSITNKSKTDVEIESDIGFLQSEINKLRGEINLLRANDKSRGNSNNYEAHDADVAEILKMNPFLKEEQLKNYEDLKDYVEELEKKAQASKDKTHDLLSKLEEQTEHMHSLQEKMQNSMFSKDSLVDKTECEISKELLELCELPKQILKSEDGASSSGKNSTSC